LSIDMFLFLNYLKQFISMNILITGIVSSGKSHIAKSTQQLLSSVEGVQETHHISLGRLYSGIISKRFNVPKENIGGVEETLAMGVREGLLPSLVVEHMQERSHNYLIDLPLTIFRKDHRTVRTFTMEQIMRFHEYAPIDHIVCIVPPTVQVAAKLDSKRLSAVHPTNPETLLGWIAAEVLLSQNLAEVLHTPLSIIPSGFSESTIAKIICERAWYGKGESPPEIYLAQPISNIKVLEAEADKLDADAKEAKGPKAKSISGEAGEKRALAKQYRDEIASFRDGLQQHAIVVNPIELADVERGDAHYSHTFHRDLYWFVHYTDMTVAFFPANLPSTGVDREIAEVKLINKPCALVHPNASQASDHPFKAAPSPSHRFNTGKAFFESVSSLPSPFSRLTQNGVPRYSKLFKKPFALSGNVVKSQPPPAKLSRKA
jgi:hypothetical protein